MKRGDQRLLEILLKEFVNENDIRNWLELRLALQREGYIK